jgi:outer membrane protein
MIGCPWAAQASSVPIPPRASIATDPTSVVLAPLTLEQALQAAFAHQAELAIAQEQVIEADALTRAREAGLHPHLSLTAMQSELSINLAALGFRPGILPQLHTTLVGPYNNFDMRLHATQALYQPELAEQVQVSRSRTRQAALQARLVREHIASLVHIAYLATLRAELSLAAVQADAALADSLHKLARDQHRLGLGTGLDVTRAATRVATTQARLAAAEQACRSSHLRLQRLVGVPLTAVTPITGTLQPGLPELPSTPDALRIASAQRLEKQLLAEQLRGDEHAVGAAAAARLPRVSLYGEYGLSGNTPTSNDLLTHSVGVGVELPIFDGGLSTSQTQAAQSRLRQDQLRLYDLEQQIELDVRTAFTELTSTQAQASAAAQALELAQRELKMTQDRYRAGLGDNLEVLAAQDSLSHARDLHLSALCLQQAARINLAAALGQAATFRW